MNSPEEEDRSAKEQHVSGRIEGRVYLRAGGRKSTLAQTSLGPLHVSTLLEQPLLIHRLHLRASPTDQGYIRYEWLVFFKWAI